MSDGSGKKEKEMYNTLDKIRKYCENNDKILSRLDNKEVH
jgi:hypothetical protein